MMANRKSLGLTPPSLSQLLELVQVYGTQQLALRPPVLLSSQEYRR